MPQPTPQPTPAPRYTVAGVVTHTAPSERRPVAGARVEVRTALTHAAREAQRHASHRASGLAEADSGAGAFATTDGNGYYSIAGITGAVELRVSRDGYEPQTVAVAAATADTRVDVRLRPSFTMVEEKFDDCILANGHPIHHVFAIHHSGTLEAEAEWTGTKTYSALQLWRGGVRLAEAFARPARPLRLTALGEGGHIYEIRVVGEPDLHYTLRIRRPN